MGLRLKTATTISAIFVAVIGATYLLFSLSLLSEFKALERARTVKNLDRVSEALGVVEADLGNRALDWGHWDESLSFIAGRNDGYVESNLNYEALVPFELKHVIFLDRSGRLLFGAESYPELAAMGPLSDHVLRNLNSHEQFSAFLRKPGSNALTGMILLNQKPTFVAVSTVTDSKMQEAPQGFIVFTRELSDTLQTQIAKQTLLPLAFYAPRPERPFLTSGGSAATTAISESPDVITGFGAIRDLSGTHITTVEFSQTRDILAQGIATRNSLVLVIAVFLFIANGVVLLFVDRTVLKPLSRFSRRIGTISKTNDLSLKLPVDRSDEIGELSAAFNGLIESLRLSYQRVHEARVAAQEANEAKSKFIATVSHELRTPIHSITGMLRILKQHETATTRRRFIDMTSSSAFGLLNTINEILDFTKVESGQLSLEVRQFNLRDTVEKSARNVAAPRGTPSEQVDLLIDVSPGVPRLLAGDDHRLEQVLTNLLGNAFKFTHDGYVSLTVSSSIQRCSSRPTITFTIQDTGIGIPSEESANIFRPFHQGAPSTARLYQGSGLGLSIVKQLVERMGGTVSVSSEQHRGTTFEVSLPFDIVAPEAHFPQTEVIALIVRAGATADLVTAAARNHSRHIEVFHPERGTDLSALARRVGAFSRVVLWSPNRNDVQAIRQVVVAANLSSVPVVAVTRLEDLAQREEFNQVGALDVVDSATLLEKIVHGTFGSLSEDGDDRSDDHDLEGSPVGTPLKVLIADDTPTNCIILQSMLEDAGHSVEVVTNGLDLLNRLRPVAVGDDSGPHFDLVLTDIQMPLMDGNTAVRKLRLLERSCGAKRRLPIVAVTAHALPDEQQAMRQAGVDGIVTKPVSPTELRRVMRVCCQQSSSSPSRIDSNSSVERALARVVREVCGLPSSEADSLDIRGVYERSGKSLRRTRMILKAFCSAYGAQRDTLAAAVAAGDLNRACRAAHALKGLLLDVGAQGVAAVAAELERSCKDGIAVECAQDEASRLITSIGRVASLVDRIARSLPHG
jgi:signal transduction histidine kinase/CheY-like chemotaxis protein